MIAAVAFALTAMTLGYRKIGLPPVVIVSGSSVVHDRDAQVHGEIERDGGRAIRVPADVTS